MSVSFFIKGRSDDEENYLNMSNSNAASLLEFVGYFELAYDLQGEVKAKELNLRCQMALNRRDADPGLQPMTDLTTGGAHLINCGRRPGYLREKTDALLALCREAGDLGVICFG